MLQEPSGLMLAAFTTAANGMAVQSQRLDAIAASVASSGVAAAPAAPAGNGAQPVRIGALPVGDDALGSMVSMNEVALAYRLNAAVLATADDMLGTLLDMIPPDKR